MSHKIGVIPGDGTGPEVVAEALKVLEAVAAQTGFAYELTNYDFGGTRYLQTGETLSDADIEQLRTHDAVLLGAIGHPDVPPGVLEQGVLLKARFALDQYINLRPVRLIPGVETPIKGKGPKEIDYCVIRENTGGMYTGLGGNSRPGTKDEVAVQEMIYTYDQVARCLRFAFEYTRKHGKKARGVGERNTLALIGKSNVLTYMYKLWNRVFAEIGEEYPDVEREYYHVDATCLYMVASPEMFDVMVVENMFGDIITDLGAMTQGGLGVAAGGNINPEGVSMFEPIGGTAPMWTGKNAINPLAAIGALQMLLEHLGETEAAGLVDRGIAHAVSKMKSMTANEMGMGTDAVGDLVVGSVSKG